MDKRGLYEVDKDGKWVSAAKQDSSNLVKSLEQMEKELDQTSNVVTLMQKDFDNGTYRIRKAGKYVLGEDISFAPRADNDYRPACDAWTEFSQGPAVEADVNTPGDYCSNPAYRLGFFAAITLETSDIIFDLNGKTIQMAPIFALQQRFFSLIALHDQPFVGPQGPASKLADGSAMGGKTESCTRCVVRNGNVGVSSHHGIRGNGVSKLLLKNLNLQDYEVGAVHLAGGNEVVIDNVHAKGHRADIPVKATYSQGRFMEQVV